jgi:uncharacterized protein (TIGR01615 family)
MLGYILHTKWQWSVKFCLKASGTWDSLLPAPWIEDVLVVSPSKTIQCIVDLNFRAKFMVRNAREYDEVVSAIPRVYLGSLQQLARDTRKYADPFQQLFKHNCQKLPPWRQTSTYMRLYTTCVDCDAVPSYVLLRTINQQLAKFSKDAACVFKGPGGLDDHHLDCLLNILGTVDNLDASLLHLSEPSGHWADSYFEKEPPCVPTPAPTQSALSSLLEEIGST